MRPYCLIASFVVLLGCSSDPSCEDDKNCDPASGGSGGNGADGGTGATGGTGGTGGDGGGCDTTKSPSGEACLVSEDYAVFVSPTGSDSASGTRADPLKTITEAATVAAGSKIVVVCNSTYDEHVSITAGAKVYGGFDCTSWAYESGARPSVSPATAGYALEIHSSSGAVVVEDIAFKSIHGAAPGESSIAAFVHETPSVELTRVELEAGKGVKGADGILTDFTLPAATVLNGNMATATNGGMPKMYAGCPGGGTTTGGVGGTAPFQAGGPGLPLLGAGQGGTDGTNCSNGVGGNGASASPPAGDSPGATTLATLASTGFTPSAGTDGAPGGVGQGGGGGASDALGGGGSGGAGGCGGAGGGAGKGGGASIALAIFNSGVNITSSQLISSDAGDGGKGAAGQAGMPVGGNGGFQSGLGGCQGGKGGAGGTGGTGGGGAGGISAGIGYFSSTSTAPIVDTETTFSLGNTGGPGIGGNPGTNDGIATSAENVVELN